MVTRYTNIIILSTVFPFFGVLAVALRAVSKRRSLNSSLEASDYLMIPSLFFTIGIGITNVYGAVVGRLGKHEVLGRNGFTVENKAFGVQIKILFALQILHTWVMPCIKLSFLLFYRRLKIIPRQQITRGFNLAFWSSIIFIAVWFVSILSATIVAISRCSAIVSDDWGLQPSQIGLCPESFVWMFRIAALSNTLSDVTVLMLPWPQIWKLKIRTGQKVELFIVFLTGFLVVIAGVGRTVAYFKVEYGPIGVDISYRYYSLVAWTVVEPSLGVISACLPTMRALLVPKSKQLPTFHSHSREDIGDPLTQRSRSQIQDRYQFRNSRSSASSTIVEKGVTVEPFMDCGTILVTTDILQTDILVGDQKESSDVNPKTTCSAYKGSS